MQYITRKGSFDSMHRVMNERMKCFNIHGHTYLYEITFAFEQMDEIGYAIDFKEIKRVYQQWIDDYLDHGAILNPSDTQLIDVSLATNSKHWLMTLNGGCYCNPSVENIAKEVFLAMKVLTMHNCPSLSIYQVRLWETPNCYTDCFTESISEIECSNFVSYHFNNIKKYAEDKGVEIYDDRKITNHV